MEAFLSLKRRPESRKGHWSCDEDKLLVELVIRHGPRNWSTIAKKMKGRRGSSCRARWMNHLNPQVVKTPFSEEEKERLLQLYKDHGSKWSSFVAFFRGRTDCQLKNLYHSLAATRKKAKEPPIPYWAAPPNMGGSMDFSGGSNGLTNVSQFADVAWWGKKTDLPLFNGGGGGSSSIYAGGSTLFGAHRPNPGGFYPFENTNIGNGYYANLGKNNGDPMMSRARSAAPQAKEGGARMKNYQFIDFLGVGKFQNN
ncbi:hypothetical protein ACP275_12G044300 [Erythranthe tilingii]